MPKRKRLFTPLKNKTKPNHNRDSNDAREVSTARGRLKGALMEVLDPTAEESDASSEFIPDKRGFALSCRDQRSEDEEGPYRRKRSPHRQSYVLKLFDRSVDLSQFNEESPLYPICRAWIANQPRANYNEFGSNEDIDQDSDTLELPGPEGSHVSKIPPLLPEQLRANKNNINLNYGEAPPPTREQLLASHSSRWLAVRQAWLEQAAKVEARYESAQQLLNKINVNAI